MKKFSIRSAERELAEDRQRIDSIRQAIDNALRSFEFEHDNFKKRVSEITLRAALLAGNDTGEQIDREPADSRLLNDYDGQIRDAETRLNKLSELVAHLKFIRATVTTRLGD